MLSRKTRCIQYSIISVAFILGACSPSSDNPPPDAKQIGAPAGISPNASTLGFFLFSNGYFALHPKFVESDEDLRFQMTYGRVAYGVTLPIAGNFDRTGRDTVGFYNPRNQEFFIRNSNQPGTPDLQFRFGPDVRRSNPVAGDWNKDGLDTVGIFDSATATFYLKNSNDAGVADLTFQFGEPLKGIGVAGDWNGDGVDTIGFYNALNGEFSLRNSNSAGPEDVKFKFGPVAKEMFPVVGDWDGNGTDTVGVYDSINRVAYLRNSNSAGEPDYTIRLEPSNMPFFPVAGKWRKSTAPAESDGFAWPLATGASQGLSDTKLDAAVAKAKTLPFMRSMVIIRHGKLVREAYFNGARSNIAHNVASVSKSIQSALFGIAINEGKVTNNLNTPIRSLLPASYFPATPDPRLDRVTLGHLMTMSTGLQSNDETSLAPLFQTDNWVRYSLSVPFDSEPGANFQYFTGNTIVAGHILEDKVGIPMKQYAKEKLFDPLGIKFFCWNEDIENYSIGGSDVCMKPRDLARFGYLYLNRGLVDGQQIVPASWVDLSTAALRTASNGGYFGLWWWHPIQNGSFSDLYRAIGHGGQYVTVIPSLDAVIVFTAVFEVESPTQENLQYSEIDKLLSEYVLPAF